MEVRAYYCCCVTSLPRSLLLGSHLLIFCAWGGGGTGGFREWVNNQVLLTLELSQAYNQLLARDCDYFMIGLGTDPKKETIVFVTWPEKKYSTASAIFSSLEVGQEAAHFDFRSEVNDTPNTLTEGAMTKNFGGLLVCCNSRSQLFWGEIIFCKY